MRRSQEPLKRDRLIVFFDLAGFGRFSAAVSDSRIFRLMSGFFELVGDAVEGSGGRVVKFIGDAGLLIYPRKGIERGVRALLRLRGDANRWLAQRSMNCEMRIKAHAGPVACGRIGTRKDKRFDVYGEAVNAAARLPSGRFSITPPVFRGLAPGTRAFFTRRAGPARYDLLKA